MNPRLAHHPVVRDFLRMARYTSPHGNEHARFDPILFPLGWTRDVHGNYHYDVGDQPTTLFLAHADTADRKSERVRFEINGTMVQSDGTTILGADNRAGMAVLLHLIREGVPGHYAIVLGEEVGMVGSRKMATDTRIYDYLRAIAFDRRGYDSIITHQMGERGCSDSFVSALVGDFQLTGLTMRPDDGGSFTDSYSFFSKVPECTNISVGYENAHSKSEILDLEFLVDLAEACVQVGWDDLPVERDPMITEYSRWSTPPWQDWGDDGPPNYPPPKTTRYYYGPDDDRDIDGVVVADGRRADIEWALDADVLSVEDVKEYIYHDPEAAAIWMYNLLRRN